MKRAFTIAIILMGLPLMSILISQPTFAGNTIEMTLSESSPIEVFYFHRTRRCASCHNIENLTRKALETQYAQELKDGRVILRIVNIELSENSQIVSQFKVSGVALIIAWGDDTDQQTSDFTAMAYRYARNEGQFMSELKKVIDHNMQ